LLDLIRLRVSSIALQVHAFFDSRPSEQVVTSLCSLLETKVEEDATQIVEVDVGVRPTAEQSAISFSPRVTLAGYYRDER